LGYRKSMKPPAFQFYADDFLAGVADMTQAEVGAYILLLCHQWNRGSAPVEPERQQLLAKGSVSAHVLSKFRLQEDGTIKNERMEREREKQAAHRAKQREKGIISGIARREHRLNRGSTVASTAAEPEGQPNTNSPSPSPSPTNTPYSPPVGDDPALVAIYEAYPRRAGRGPALKAIAKAAQGTTPLELLEATQAYAAATASWPAEDREFIPHPSTWFNQQRYLDDRATWARGSTTEDEGPRVRRVML
jgi:uncharacterized protein YdaU (DUF1376 family)